jgi:hypothetical protein
MKKRETPKLKTPKQRKREQGRQFKPFAEEIGWITYEWNRLQESLAELFADAMGDEAISLKVWHTVRSDLTQREMLKAAAAHRMSTVTLERQSVWKEVRWLVNEATNLSHKRNDAIHVPFVFVTHADKIEVLPLYFLGNPKAKRLASKEPLEEFKWYRESLAVLADYAMTLHYAVAFTDYPLSRRPALPNLRLKAKGK